MILSSTDSLRKQVYEYLKEKIACGELRPGEMIDQKEMQERLGVEPARMRRSNNRGLSDARLIELMQASLREGKPHPDLKVMRAGAMDDPRIQVD